MIHSKRTTTLLMTLLLIFGLVSVVQANWLGTIPGTSISAQTTDEVYVNSSTLFSSATESWANQSIGTIGWTTRSNRQVCGGTVVYSYSLPAVANYNTNVAYVGPSSSTSTLKSCPYGGARSVGVATYHEFKVSGVSPFYKTDGDTLPAP